MQQGSKDPLPVQTLNGGPYHQTRGCGFEREPLPWNTRVWALSTFRWAVQTGVGSIELLFNRSTPRWEVCHCIGLGPHTLDWSERGGDVACLDRKSVV